MIEFKEFTEAFVFMMDFWLAFSGFILGMWPVWLCLAIWGLVNHLIQRSRRFEAMQERIDTQIRGFRQVAGDDMFKDAVIRKYKHELEEVTKERDLLKGILEKRKK